MAAAAAAAAAGRAVARLDSGPQLQFVAVWDVPAVGGCASDQELFHAQARDYEGLIAEDRAEVQRLEKQLAERLARRRLGEPSAAVAALAQP